MKRNGSYAKSKIEDEFYEALCAHFGKDDIERQSSVNGWPIDFFVKSRQTYVQFDGVYWHGLDRPLNMILENKSPRDRVIYGKWLTDCQQDEWFYLQNLKLVRVTDRQWTLDTRVSSYLS